MGNQFENSLKSGHVGEIRMNAIKPAWVRTNGLKEDFILPDGDYLELKTESRASTDTPNIAVELSSSPGKPGALQSAVNNGCKYICFLFADDKYYIYNAQKLLEYVLSANHRTVKVANANYNSVVMLVPRTAVEDLLCQI
jgi:hypothetical protein